MAHFLDNYAERVNDILILSDDDLRRMVALGNRGQTPSLYLRDRMSEFVRSI